MMYCKVCFDRDGSYNSKTVQATCINEKTGVRFDAWVCESCLAIDVETRVNCWAFNRMTSDSRKI